MVVWGKEAGVKVSNSLRFIFTIATVISQGYLTFFTPYGRTASMIPLMYPSIADIMLKQARSPQL